MNQMSSLLRERLGEIREGGELRKKDPQSRPSSEQRAGSSPVTVWGARKRGTEFQFWSTIWEL